MNPTTFNGQTYTYNDNNQCTGQGIAYGVTGELTTFGTRSYAYDGASHLTSANQAITCTYTGDGLRAKKVSAAGTTYYVYDGETLVAECDGNGTVTTINTWGADGLVMRGGEIYLCDPLGNVVVRTDLDGTVLASDAYDAWGNLLACKDPQGNDYTLTGDPYGYKAQYGYYTDRETGLILCTHRYYDPSTGRWLTRDPIGYEGGINLYQYCGNDPVNGVDPSGQFLETFVDIAGIAWSIVDLVREPSWISAGFLLWDIGAAILPFVPGSYVAKGVKLAAHADDVADGVKAIKHADEMADGAKSVTILGENMTERVIPFAEGTGARTLPWGTTPEKWAQMTPKQRWKLNDGLLRKRINEGDNFRYIGQDPFRSPLDRQRFDLTRAELLRLFDKGISYERVPPHVVMQVIGRL